MIAAGLFLPAITAARQAADRARQRQLMAQGGFAMPGNPGEDIQARAADVIKTTDEICDLLQGVNDVPSAQAASPRFNVLSNHLEQVHQFQGARLGDAINNAGFLDKMSLSASFGTEIKRVNARYAAELNRLRSMSDVWDTLQGQSAGFANAPHVPRSSASVRPRTRFDPSEYATRRAG